MAFGERCGERMQQEFSEVLRSLRLGGLLLFGVGFFSLKWSVINLTKVVNELSKFYRFLSGEVVRKISFPVAFAGGICHNTAKDIVSL